MDNLRNLMNGGVQLNIDDRIFVLVNDISIGLIVSIIISIIHDKFYLESSKKVESCIKNNNVDLIGHFIINKNKYNVTNLILNGVLYSIVYTIFSFVLKLLGGSKNLIFIIQISFILIYMTKYFEKNNIFDIFKN